MHELVNECKLLDIEVLPPDFRWQEANFHIKDNKIYFGMGNVKGIGQSKIKKLFNLCQDTPVEELDWFSLLLNVFSGLDITIVENLILVGAFDYLKIPRIRMHYEYGVWNRLTEKEQDWIKTTSTQNSILEAIREAAKPRKEGGACANKNRIAELEDLIKILEHPPFALKDSTGKIAIDEQRLLGISLTAHETDSGSSEATCSCKEFLGGFSGNIVLAVTITRMNEYKTKKGKNPGQAMAFLTVEDISCALDSLVVFPEVYAEFKSLLVKDNTVLIYGNRSKENSLIVQKVIQI
jgi:DNA polymerase-3 subunit alpha